ncbi:hypothetical protein PAXRUDRAFT_162302, partial [Paxillus rubicundulus Ve08.2h10]
PAWKNILKDLKMLATLMPCNVTTHWNSMFNMLDYAFSHRNAVDAITQRRDLGLRKFELGNHEWALLQELCDVLRDATLFFSWSMPNLATVIPVMDHINQVLTTNSLKRKFSPTICVSLGVAKKTLNHYHQLTDSSEVYCIAMGTCFSSI